MIKESSPGKSINFHTENKKESEFVARPDIFSSDLPSYEDAMGAGGSISSSTIKKENSDGKIISTTVNGDSILIVFIF